MTSNEQRDMLASRNCLMCGTIQHIYVNYADFMAWRDGMLIQKAMPYLTPDEREMLISQTCGSCWDKFIFEERGDE